MSKILFECDYNEGCHPRILTRLCETNMEQTVGYSEDQYCAAARETVKRFVGRDDVAVHFLVGGTQTNTTVIASTLRPYEGVLSASTGHINAHETGAIEATGHKVLALPSSDGKITAEQVREAVKLHASDFAHEHIVKPGMVYISYPTENGTLYTLSELRAMSEACHDCNIPLFLDGARLGYGLTAPGNDVTVADIAKLCDVFYIGGTKVGALFGEAVVISNEAIKRDFRYMIKQHGGMLAKGRLLGLQFDELLKDGLYLQLGEHANKLAQRVHAAFAAKGYPFRYDSPTNQQFPILPDAHIAILGEKYSYDYWGRVDATHSTVRFCTSWATKEEAVDQLCKDVAALPQA